MIYYKYNIYHSKKTKYLDKMLRECCFVWNHALALQRRYYKLFGKYISFGKMKKHFTKRIKRNLLHSQTTQEILERLDESYNRFFKKLAKRPYAYGCLSYSDFATTEMLIPEGSEHLFNDVHTAEADELYHHVLDKYGWAWRDPKYKSETELCAMLKWAKEKGLTIEELSI